MSCNTYNTFAYDGIDLSRFNSVICFFEDYTGNQPTGLEKEIQSSEYNIRRHEKNLYGAVYSAPLEFKVGIMKTDYTDYTPEESRNLNAWLTHSNLYTILHFDNNFMNLDFYAICKNVEDVYYSGISGKEITFECNSPFGYELEKKYIINGTEDGEEIEIFNNSDDGDYYPTIEITVDRSVLPKVTIENETDNNSVTIDFYELIGKNISKPSIAISSYFYNGNYITPELVYDSYSTEIVTTESITTAKNIGNYSIAFRLNNTNYTWDDGTNNDVILDWNINPYIIHYNLDNGVVEGELKTEYTIDDTFTLPIPEKYAYNFIGWTGGKNGEITEPTLDVTIPLGSTGNRTYYANYEFDSKNTFRFSNNKPFILETSDHNKHWDGDIEYSVDNCNTWTVWDGTSTLSGDSDHAIYMRGTNNTVITGNLNSSWNFTGKYCNGNIEVLLDYQTVLENNHPTMANYCYANMFSDCTSLITPPQLPATTLVNSCYANMFYNCTSLVTAPELPATTLADECYAVMFHGCTSLTTPPELPATTLADYCYWYMFESCTSLTTPSELPATTLAENCYAYMFKDCTSLTQAPELLATTLANTCYNGMFEGCTSLTTPPELPATTLGVWCYYNMFRNCTSLVTAPELPATTLAYECYKYMFECCTSLIQAPELPATTLADGCYYGMFSGCTSLAVAPELPAMTLGFGCYQNMFEGCTSLSTLPDLPATMLAERCYEYMFNNCKLIKISTTWSDEYWKEYRIPITGTATTATNALKDMFSNTGGTFTGTPTINTVYYTPHLPVDNSVKFSSDSNFTLSAPKNWDGTLEYTLDNGGNWIIWDGSQLSGTATQPIYLRGTGNSVIKSQNSHPWAFTGKYCTGNIENLLDYQTVANGEHPVMGRYCYFLMFYNCTSLIQAPELLATTLADNCYNGMFQGCTSLIQAPELPATTLDYYCYYDMFFNCTSLIQAPELPATTLLFGCYTEMFRGCTSLAQSPELPATTLANECYKYMFRDCTSLITVPELPATKLVNSCYQSMFQGCTSLKISTTQTGEYQYAYRIPITGTGTTASSSALTDMFKNTGGAFTGAPTINTTYYTNNKPV